MMFGLETGRLTKRQEAELKLRGFKMLMDGWTGLVI